MPSRAEISVAGVVQGVGYRPFIFRLAARRGLNGMVRNMGDAGDGGISVGQAVSASLRKLTC